MEGPSLPESFNTDLHIPETEQLSRLSVSSQDTGTKIHTNTMEPEHTHEYRNVALNRFVGMDTPSFTHTKNIKGGKGLTAKDAFRQFERALYSSDERMESIKTIEKSPQQKEICEMIIRELPKFLVEFGLDKPALIPESAIQITDMSHLEQKDREKAKKRASAIWSSSQQRIQFNGDTVENMTNLEFAKKVAHELVHAQSFNSLQNYEYMNEEGGTERIIRKRRGGLVNYVYEEDKDGKKFGIDYFAELDEAITESLAQHFIYTYLYKIPHIEADIESFNVKLREIYHTEKAKNPDVPIVVADNVTGLRFGDEETDDIHQVDCDSGSYWKEIEQFQEANKLAAERAREYQEEFARTNIMTVQPTLHSLLMSIQSEMDVTKLMSRAYFTGNQLDFARLSTFVTKRSFREIGDLTSLVKKRYPENFN